MPVLGPLLNADVLSQAPERSDLADNVDSRVEHRQAARSIAPALAPRDGGCSQVEQIGNSFRSQKLVQIGSSGGQAHYRYADAARRSGNGVAGAAHRTTRRSRRLPGTSRATEPRAAPRALSRNLRAQVPRPASLSRPLRGTGACQVPQLTADVRLLSNK